MLSNKDKNYIVIIICMLLIVLGSSYILDALIREQNHLKWMEKTKVSRNGEMVSILYLQYQNEDQIQGKPFIIVNNYLREKTYE